MVALLVAAVAVLFACRHALRQREGAGAGPAAERQRLTLEAAMWCAAGLALYAAGALLGAAEAALAIVSLCFVMALAAFFRLSARPGSAARIGHRPAARPSGHSHRAKRRASAPGASARGRHRA
jgi:hypothetical protein